MLALVTNDVGHYFEAIHEFTLLLLLRIVINALRLEAADGAQQSFDNERIVNEQENPKTGRRPLFCPLYLPVYLLHSK
jgi:hypothetical protein